METEIHYNYNYKATMYIQPYGNKKSRLKYETTENER